MTKTELIQKFLNNDCSAEEARRAMQYLQEEPHLLDELLTKEEWDGIDLKQPLRPDLEAGIRKQVLARTNPRPVVRVMKIMGVAASVAAIVFLASLLLNKTMVETVNAPVSEVKQSTAPEKIVNSTREIKKINLPDHSTVILYPGSSIEFEKEFTSNRDINLSGKATFTVTKDAQHPFTVFAGNISTTALGTRFMVDNSGGANKLNIKLYEGKVVVKAANPAVHIEDTYLQPGQQCFIDISLNSILVDAMFTERLVVRREAVKPAAAEKPAPVVPVTLSFTQTPLVTVFENLEKVFETNIFYESQEISGANFTGDFDESDSLTAILKVIAGMNGLEITGNKEEGFVIRKTGSGSFRQYNADSQNRNLYGRDIAAILSLQPAENAFAEVKPVKAPDPIGLRETEDALHFYNSPLWVVIEKIRATNEATINYEEKDLSGLYFSGTIKKDKSTINMLQVICRMNNLKMVKQDEGYRITK